MTFKQESESLFWQDGVPIAGSTTFGYNTGTSQTFGGTSQHEPAALGDMMQFTVNLDPGDYTLDVIGIHATASGIHDLKLDGLLLGTFDYYSGSFDFNVVVSMPVTIINQTSILTSEVIGQNASSSGFYIAVSRIRFIKL